MKVIHLSSSDQVGGAARAAYRLNAGLRQISIDFSLYVSQKHGDDDYTVEFKASRAISNRLKYKLRHRLITRERKGWHTVSGAELFSTDLSPFGNDILSKLSRANIYNLHWVAGFVDYESCLPTLAKEAKLVWTIHDMNPFTGGCHYDDSCGQFVAKCGKCPQLASSSNNDLSATIWLRKSRAFAKLDSDQLHIVAPSVWMADEIKQSSLLKKFSISVIPYGLDTQEYTPHNRWAMRTILCIPTDARVILFVADGLNNARKGMRYLWEALAKIRHIENLVLISVGNGEVKNKTNIPHINLNAINNNLLLSAIYSAADVFVIPSLQDNSPLTIMESLSCGTPVVGFDVGGIPDMVLPGKTGSLVPVRDSQGLCEAILSVLSDPRKDEMSNRCRQFAVDKLDYTVQARAYLDLYSSLVK